MLLFSSNLFFLVAMKLTEAELNFAETFNCNVTGTLSILTFAQG